MKNGVEVTRPLRHRPDVIVVTTRDGRRKVIGDGGGFTSAEIVQLQGLAPSTTPRLEFTETEQAELAAAEERLARASALVDSLWQELAAHRKKIDELAAGAFDPWGNPKASAEAAGEEVHRLQEAGREISRRIAEAREVEQQALVERNEARRRITAAARARQSLPATSLRSTEERLEALERRR